MYNLMVYLFIGLFLVMLVQIILIKVKGNSIDHMENQDRIDELMSYIKAGKGSYVDASGRNVLMIAAATNYYGKRGENNYLDVVKTAIQAGIRVDTKSLVEEKTALFYALSSPSGREVAEYLLACGANPMATDKKGRIPLFESIKRNGSGAYDLMVEKTSDINHQSHEGVTALMVAARYMNIPAIHDLLDRGANVKLVQKDGLNAYDIGEKHKKEFYQRSGDSASSNNDDKHNHTIDEVVRKLYCAVHDKPYKARKFVPRQTSDMADDGI